MNRLVGLIVIFCIVGAAAVFAQDFKKEEILCGAGESPLGQRYTVAKVLKPASCDTKNQAQVLFIGDGSKAWVDFVIPSHPAKKGELAVGAIAFYPSGWAEYDTIGADEYRKTEWGLGRITSLDEMFKNLVEIDGAKYIWKFVRIPDNPAALEPKSE